MYCVIDLIFGVAKAVIDIDNCMQVFLFLVEYVRKSLE